MQRHERQVEALTEALRAERTARASRLGEDVADELASLGMGEGEFLVELREREVGPTGGDEVTFLIRPNAGLPFAPIADMEVASLSDLGDLQAELQPTIETCESIDDWIAGAQTVLDEEVNPATARLLLGIQCNDPTLSNTAVCEELASS